MDRERVNPPENDRVAKKMKLTALEITDLVSDDDDGDLLRRTEALRPLGVFEFPWLKEEGFLAAEMDGCDLCDVFFSSLVDNISPPRVYQIVIPGEAEESSPSDEDADGADCIWSCALRQPLSGE